jgi:hypothetical protein
LLVFLRFRSLLTSLLPSCLLRFGGVDDRGVDLFAGVLAMVETIPFDDVVVLCFLLRCVFFVWSSRSVCLLAYDSCQLEFYMACHQHGGVGRISVNESSTEEKDFCSSKDPMEDLISFLCSIVTKDITL